MKVSEDIGEISDIPITYEVHQIDPTESDQSEKEEAYVPRALPKPEIQTYAIPEVTSE